jgi:hypothetical protein
MGEVMSSLKLQIQTTALCNARCAICPHVKSGLSKRGGTMGRAEFAKVIESAKSLGKLYKVALYMQAEPLLDDQIAERVIIAGKELDVGYVELSSNAALLTEDRAWELRNAFSVVRGWVDLSFHGTGREEHTRLMGLPYERTLENIRTFLRITDDSDLRRRIVTCSPTDRANEFWNGWFRKWGVIRTPPIRTFTPNNRGGTVNKSIASKRAPDNYLQCVRMRQWVHVNWQGRVVLCCNDYSHEPTFGSALVKDLASIRQRMRGDLETMAASSGIKACEWCDGRLV